MGLNLVTPASEDLITLAEAKEHLIVDDDFTDDDAYIARLIDAMTAKVESETESRFVTQTWDWYLDRFPSRDYMEVPYPPLQSVTSITYLDEQGSTQTFANTDYIVDPYSPIGRIALGEGYSWPGTQSVINAVTVKFVCGYGAAAVVPEGLKHALKLYLSLLYENREPIVTGTIVSRIPDSIDALIWDFKSKVIRFG